MDRNDLNNFKDESNVHQIYSFDDFKHPNSKAICGLFRLDSMEQLIANYEILQEEIIDSNKKGIPMFKEGMMPFDYIHRARQFASKSVINYELAKNEKLRLFQFSNFRNMPGTYKFRGHLCSLPPGQNAELNGDISFDFALKLMYTFTLGNFLYRTGATIHS